MTDITLHIRVTEKEIRAGIRNNRYHCPYACAILAALNALPSPYCYREWRVSVETGTQTFVITNPKNYRSQTHIPSHMFEEIINYDNKVGVISPREFSITIPLE